MHIIVFIGGYTLATERKPNRETTCAEKHREQIISVHSLAYIYKINLYSKEYFYADECALVR